MSSTTIKVDGKDFEIKATGATSIFYQEVFGEDFLNILANAAVGNFAAVPLESVCRACFIMAKQAEGNSVDEFPSITKKDYIKWADSFSFQGLMSASNDIMAFLNDSGVPTADLKKTETKKE